MPPPRVPSGIQPRADSFHLGNYLGAPGNGWHCRRLAAVTLALAEDRLGLLPGVRKR